MHETDWRDILRRYPQEVHEELISCLRSNRLPTGEAFKLLLELTSILKRKCCSEFARKIGRDKGNLYDWKEKQLTYELATNQYCFGFVKEKVLSFFRQEQPDLFSRKSKPHTIQRLYANGVWGALRRKDEKFFAAITYSDISPPTGRLLASKAATRNLDIDTFWLYSLFKEKLGLGQHPNATVTFCAYILGLSNRQVSDRWLNNLLSELDWHPEYSHSAIVGVSNNPFAVKEFQTGRLREDALALAVNSVFLRHEPQLVAQKIADFERRRGASAEDILSRVLQRAADLRAFLDRRNSGALLLLQTLPLVAMSESESFLSELLLELVPLIDCPEVKWYRGIQRALDWLISCLKQLY